ncbi:hypothetical protein BT96DRAFT_973225 [Gymnopus androsaceus JB14]|uniref:Uncharacterized protein n=1 Tax=Gymnopus androsaceus JB14 TaxID=1447944 RepID=A0A6A4I6G8_9AGAR|nr:hypothetical protein BT96DRAFT_973225 [Gymnopus androsaceus JB14]
MDEVDYSDASSTFTSSGTFTSSSTIPGLGALSGKAIKRLGTSVVNGLDAFLIRRRLAQLEAIFENKSVSLSGSDTLESLYSDLLELSRRSVYPPSIHKRAFRLIMGVVGGMEFEPLAAAVARWQFSESYDLLSAIVLCLRSEVLPDADYLAGLDAYKVRLPYASSELSSSGIFTAFLLYLSLTISLSQKPAFAKLVIGVNILTFITEYYPGIHELKSYWPRHLLPAQLVLRTLLEKLDPIEDVSAISQLLELLPVTTEDTPFGDQLPSSIHSNVLYFRNMRPSQPLIQIEAIIQQKSVSSTEPSASNLSLYIDLLELSRPMYRLSSRIQAFHAIMGIVGGMEFEDLVAGLVGWPLSESHYLGWPLSESHGLFKAMVFCFRTQLQAGGLRRDLHLLEARGMDAYMVKLPYSSWEGLHIGPDLYIAFLLFIGLAISHSSAAFSRIFIDLDILTFISELYPYILELKSHWPKHLIPVQLLLRSLLEKLDPIKDASVHQLRRLLALNPEDGPYRTDTISSIQSNIAYFRTVNRQPLAQIEAIVGYQTIPHTLKSHGIDLLELNRAMYSLSIRTRAFCQIMAKIGGLDFKNLAAAVAEKPISLSSILLGSMLLCLQHKLNSIEGEQLDVYHAAGLDAYKRSQLVHAESISAPDLCNPLLMFFGHAISLSTGPAFSRLVLGLDILMFITMGILEPLNDLPPLGVHLVLIALLEKLDPVKDTSSIAQLQEIWMTITSSITSQLQTMLLLSDMTTLESASRRWLVQIENLLGQEKPHSLADQLSLAQTIYCGLLELSQRGCTLSIQMQASHLIRWMATVRMISYYEGHDPVFRRPLMPHYFLQQLGNSDLDLPNFTVFVQGGSPQSISILVTKETSIGDIKSFLVAGHYVPLSFWISNQAFLTIPGRFRPLEDGEMLGELGLGSLSHLQIRPRRGRVFPSKTSSAC